MNILKFNTKKHTLDVVLTDGTNLSYEDVSTIKEGTNVYEVYQKQRDGLNAPIIKIPVTNTIVMYSHYE
jgi:hypothetical protein